MAIQHVYLALAGESDFAMFTCKSFCLPSFIIWMQESSADASIRRILAFHLSNPHSLLGLANTR